MAGSVGTAAGASASTARVARVSAETARQAAPAAPTGLVATADAGRVSLSWNASASGATSYDIYVGTTSAFRGGLPSFVSKGAGTSGPPPPRAS